MGFFQAQKYTKNQFSAGALPWTPLEELTTLLQISSWLGLQSAPPARLWRLDLAVSAAHLIWTPIT